MKFVVNKKRMLITGVSGLLGNNLAFCLKYKYDILGLYNTHKVEIDGIKTQKVNLTCIEVIQQIVDDFCPDVIIHCAAISDVDFCEKEPVLAKEVNVIFQQILFMMKLRKVF